MALVVADTFEAGREAAYQVRITYRDDAPSATFGSNGVTEQDMAKATAEPNKIPQAGDADAAYAAADVRLDVEYGTPTQHHNPIELFSTTCVWRDQDLTIYEPCQFVYGLRASVAQQLGIDIDRVRVVSPFVGGAF